KQIDLSLDDAREVVYGMPYSEWKARYQKEANAEQQAAFVKETKQHD
ncbi:cell division protein DedD, partial [Pseudomonas syringae pv. syringae FF5]